RRLHPGEGSIEASSISARPRAGVPQCRPMTEAERREALAATVRRGSRPGALARACLLVARGEYPLLDPTVSLAEIARLTSRVRETVDAGVKPPWRVLAEVLGRSEG